MRTYFFKKRCFKSTTLYKILLFKEIDKKIIVLPKTRQCQIRLVQKRLNTTLNKDLFNAMMLCCPLVGNIALLLFDDNWKLEFI